MEPEHSTLEGSDRPLGLVTGKGKPTTCATRIVEYSSDMQSLRLVNACNRLWSGLNRAVEAKGLGFERIQLKRRAPFIRR